MTLPRQILSNTTYLLTRRTNQRQFFLKPSKTTNQVFLYCLAIAASKTGVKIHAACVMSNHWHAVVSDPAGRIPEFYGWVHKYVAKALNCHYGRWENLWSTDKTSLVTLGDTEDVLDKMLYTVCNPVAANLVNKVKEWPGICAYKKSHSKKIRRPSVYFKREGTMPAHVQFKIEPLPSRYDLSSKMTEQFLAEKMNQIEFDKKDEGIVGRRHILQQVPTETPSSNSEKRKLSPRFGIKDKTQRMAAIKQYKKFISQYSQALRKWKEERLDAIFPPGTYALKHLVCVHCGPASG